MKIALNKSKRWKNIYRSNWNAFHYNAINTKHPYRVICLMSSLVEKRNDSLGVLLLVLLQCHCVSGSFRATQGEETWNAERMTLASQHGWADCEGDIRREKKKKRLSLYFFFHVRAVKHPRRSGYYFNEGCGWINTAPAQWCVAAESVTSSRKQIHIQQTGFVFFVFCFPPLVLRERRFFLLSALGKRVAPLLQVRRMKAGVREATVQHVRREMFLLGVVWHQSIIWRFENVQRKTRLFLRGKQMGTLMIIHLWIYGNSMFIGHNKKKVLFLSLWISPSERYLL